MWLSHQTQQGAFPEWLCLLQGGVLSAVDKRTMTIHRFSGVSFNGLALHNVAMVFAHAYAGYTVLGAITMACHELGSLELPRIATVVVRKIKKSLWEIGRSGKFLKSKLVFGFGFLINPFKVRSMSIQIY